MYLFCALILVWLGNYLWSRRRLYVLSWNMPGPIGYPLVGSAHWFFDPTKVVEKVKLVRNFGGNPAKFWLGNRLFVYLDSPELVEAILNSPICIDKGESYRFMEDFLGLGLITSKGDVWKKHRKLLNPSFHYTVTSKYIPIFNKNLRILVENLKLRGNRKPQWTPRLKRRQDTMLSFWMRYIRESEYVIAPTPTETVRSEATEWRFFGSRTKLESDYLSKAISSVLEDAGVRIFNPLLAPDLFFKWSKYYQKHQHSIQVLQSKVNAILDTKTKEFNRKKELSKTGADDELELTMKENHLFVDRILKLALEDQTFTLQDVLDETCTTIIAGYETTATSASFVMLMLAMHPECQEQLYEELKSVHLGDEDVCIEAMANLKYLDMFIKETLRLFPAVPYLTRTTTSDFKLGDYCIPPGVEFVIGVIYMHRENPGYKNNPEEFDPHNFLPENVAQRHPYSYLPFSGGPRSCIGVRYANTVLKLITIYVVKNFKLSTDLKLEDLKFRMNITLNLINRHFVRLQQRK